MTCLSAIGAWDDARLFPMLRDYFKRSIPLTREETTAYFPDRLLQISRDICPQTFEEWVLLANRFNGRH